MGHHARKGEQSGERGENERQEKREGDIACPHLNRKRDVSMTTDKHHGCLETI